MPISSPTSISRPSPFETSSTLTAAFSATGTLASVTGYSSDDIFEANHIPSLESVKALNDPKEQIEQVKNIFTRLPESIALPIGEFRGDFVGLYTESSVAKAVVPWLWEGVEFDDTLATLTLNPWVAWFLPQETGKVSLADSVYDGRQTIRVDYEDRFWETRRLDDNRFLSIVTNKESGEIGDVHTLTVTQ